MPTPIISLSDLLSFLTLCSLSVLIFNVPVCSAYLNSGSSRQINRFSYFPGTTDGSIIMTEKTTVVLPDYQGPQWVYFFRREEQDDFGATGKVSHYSVTSFVDDWEDFVTLAYGCLDPSESGILYVGLANSGFRVARLNTDGSFDILYTFDSTPVTTAFYCPSPDSLLVVTDIGVLYMNFSAHTRSLYKADIPPANPFTSVMIKEKNMVVFALTDYGGLFSIALSVFALHFGGEQHNLSLVDRVSFTLPSNTSLVTCAMSLYNESALGVLLSSPSNCTLQIVTFDLSNLSAYTMQDLYASHPWCNNSGTDFKCAHFPSSSVLSLNRNAVMDNHALRISTETLETELFSWPPSLVVGSKLGFSAPNILQSTGCAIDADVSICRLYVYNVSSAFSLLPQLIRTINIATQDYDIQQTVQSPSRPEIVYALSVPRFPSTSTTTYFYYEILKLNIFAPSSEPDISITFQLDKCNNDTASALSTEIGIFEMEDNGVIMLQLMCRTLYFHSDSLLFLAISETDSECIRGSDTVTHSVSDGNGTIYEGWIDSKSLVFQKFFPQNGSCSELVDLYEFHIPGITPSALAPFLTEDNQFGVLSPNIYAKFDRSSLNMSYLSLKPVQMNDTSPYFTSLVSYAEMVYGIGLTIGDVGFDVSFISVNTSSNEFVSTWRFLLTLPNPPQNMIFFDMTDTSAQILFDSGLVITVTLPEGVIIDQIQIQSSMSPPSSSSSSQLPFLGVIPSEDGAVYLVAGASLFLVYDNCALGRYRNISSGRCIQCPPNSISLAESQQLCISCPPRTVVNTDTNQCLCTTHFYSPTNDTNCLDCPDGAVCPGHNTILAQQGYWKGAATNSSQNSSSLIFYSCPFLAGCDGDGCATGYSGPVCGICSVGYGRTPAGCAKCPKTAWHFSVPIIAVGALVLLLILILLWRDTEGDNEQFFGIVKTVLSFVQVLSFPTGRLPTFASHRLQDFYSRIVMVINTVGLRVFSAASLDCLLEKKEVPSYFVELLSVGYVPIVLGLLVLVWTQLCRSPLEKDTDSIRVPVAQDEDKKRFPEDRADEDKGSRVRREASSSASSPSPLSTQYRTIHVSDTKFGAPIRLILFVYLLLYPYVSSLLVQFFECQKVDGVYYLVADYSSQCFSVTWKRMLIAEVILTLIYPLGGPLAVFLLLKYKRHQVNVRFMTARYKSRYYYWDVIEMLRKVALLCALVWDQYEQQENLVWYSGLPLLVAGAGLLLHLHIRPHIARLDYYIHAASLLALCFLYGLPAVVPSTSLYHLLASWVVIVFMATFTVLSSLIAIYVARYQLLSLAVSSCSWCCRKTAPPRNGETTYLLVKNL